MKIIGTGLYAQHLQKLTGFEVVGARNFEGETDDLVILCTNPTLVPDLVEKCHGPIIDVTPANRFNRDWCIYGRDEVRGRKISLPGCMATGIKDMVEYLPHQPFYAFSVTLGASVAGSEVPITEFTQLGVNARHAQYDEISRFMPVPFSFNPVFGGFAHGIKISLPIFSKYRNPVVHSVLGDPPHILLNVFKDYDLLTYEMDNFTRLDRHVLECLEHFKEN